MANMPDPKVYEGLIDHLERHLGPFRTAQPPTVHGGNRGFSIAVYKHPDHDMFTAVSNGLRFQSITTLMPQEFVCSLKQEQNTFAQAIVDMFASSAVKNGRGLEYDGVIDTGRPFIPDSRIQGVLACPHPYAGEAFDLFPTGEKPILQLITLIPVTTAEIAFIGTNGADELQARWVERATDLLTIFRASAV
ncbi:uncharacterized protein DNG_02290 [Cephalotrichum gorgonifer]|uniref:Suppressor of fused-like domain-containing protein n=1 Tax=Cephalotrichum gorgonifer TaxID=2041049 RepID=A0AAE8MUV1_9PEZI|nr:uncharacterized protein DNG_02290 [Cephalotrichum gorgonifer]